MTGGVMMGGSAGKSPALSPLLVTIGLTYAVLLIASGPQVLDPFVRHDDFPALLADPSGYYQKTLEEGRWLNYWWHLRGWISPAWLNFAVYQLFWATFAGAAAVNACGRKEQIWYVLALALMIALGTPAFLISSWFNTFLPGLGLVAIFAFLATFLGPVHMRLLLLAFVPATLMSYTTYPLLLLVVCLTTRDAPRSWRDLSGLMATFVIAFCLGVLLIYSLNYAEHGIFGIPMAAWRHATPARDLASAIANLNLLHDFFRKSIMAMNFNITPMAAVYVLVLVAGLAFLAGLEPWPALYIFTGLLAGIGLVCIMMIVDGVQVPVRAVGFVWIFYGILCVRIALACRDRGWLYAGIAARVFLMVTIGLYLMGTAANNFKFTEWQVQTRKLAAQTGDGDGPIYVFGSYKALPGAHKASIQAPDGLQKRLAYLTGRKVHLCDQAPEACKNLPQQTYSGTATSIPEVRRYPDHTEILLPNLFAAGGGGQIKPSGRPFP